MHATSAPGTSEEVSPHSAAGGEYLAFQLGDEAYGINILGVQEIRSYEQPTRIAGCPPHLRGVLDLRGVSVPVMDLRVCLGLDARFDASTVTVVITPDSQRTVGLVVDSVSDVIVLREDQFRPMPSLNEDESGHCVRDLASIQQDGADRTLLLLDLPQLMARFKTGVVAAL